MAGSIIGYSSIPTDERQHYIQVACARCSRMVYMPRREMIERDGQIVSDKPYPDYIWPGWDVICYDCSEGRHSADSA